MGFPSRRWRLWLLAALLLVGAVALGYALALWPGPGVTTANFEKLHEGMTRQQVNDILGAENLLQGAGYPNDPSLEADLYYEEGGDLGIAVQFQDQRVAGKAAVEVPRTLGGFLRGRLIKVRRRLGL